MRAHKDRGPENRRGAISFTRWLQPGDGRRSDGFDLGLLANPPAIAGWNPLQLPRTLHASYTLFGSSISWAKRAAVSLTVTGPSAVSRDAGRGKHYKGLVSRYVE